METEKAPTEVVDQVESFQRMIDTEKTLFFRSAATAPVADDPVITMIAALNERTRASAAWTRRAGERERGRGRGELRSESVRASEGDSAAWTRRAGEVGAERERALRKRVCERASKREGVKEERAS